MSKGLKIIFLCIMTMALAFGFLNLFINGPNFERLHIFLFNLCSGGTIILYYTENQKSISIKVALFLFLAICYAIFAFLKIYIPCMIISVILLIIVEVIRIKNFSFFPWDFFKPSVPAYKKFHQASLLCLSIGLIISCLVILNNEFIHVVTIKKLKLNSFFLGFSFPVSLITMTVMFSLIKSEVSQTVKLLKEIAFWTISLGVITFFIFILIEQIVIQVIVTHILLTSVIMMFYLYRKYGIQLQQKNFLSSGMLFLLFTAVTGIGYIFMELTPDYTSEKMNWLLKLHAFGSLYGWNICGLTVICRYDDFPIKLHSIKLIIFHWLTVIILCPLGLYYKPVAIAAVLCYTVVLYMILFSKGSRKKYS